MSTLVLAPFFTDLSKERLMCRECSPRGTSSPVVAAHLMSCVPALLNHSQFLHLATLSHPRIFAHAVPSVWRSLPFSPYSLIISWSSFSCQLRHLLVLQDPSQAESGEDPSCHRTPCFPHHTSDGPQCEPILFVPVPSRQWPP